jgi:hypothetical protein
MWEKNNGAEKGLPGLPYTSKQLFWIATAQVISQISAARKKNSYLSSSQMYTANVYRKLQGLCGEIGMRGFQIYGDCMYTHDPFNFEISTI